jgi:hypothetical protein
MRLTGEKQQTAIVKEERLERAWERAAMTAWLTERAESLVCKVQEHGKLGGLLFEQDRNEAHSIFAFGLRYVDDLTEIQPFLAPLLRTPREL